ncbi:MAG: hypothetical protein FJ197_04930 [Gammaproteobacteria bacterium]|nr:hypothetical protein [Gammaproteobacteria bacterium]
MTLTFLFVAIACVLMAIAAVVWPLMRGGSDAAPGAALAVAIATPVTALLLYLLVTSYPWGDPPGEPAGPAPGDTAVIASLKEAVRDGGEDPADWVRLGEALMAAERFGDARDAFRAGLRAHRAPHTGLELGYAEAAILADRDALGGEAGRVVEQVLGREPLNAKALWYGGMIALGRGDTDSAAARWQLLLGLSPPPAVRQIIEEQLLPLKAELPTSGSSIAVAVSLPDAMAAQIQPGAVLFVFARKPGEGGPPLAVVRREAGTWPAMLSISEADSMVPGRSIAGAGTVEITARVANDGEALQASGDLFGVATWNSGTGSGPVSVVLDQLVP